jgi:hypothetical protein
LNVTYTVRRAVEATNRDGKPCRIALVLFQLPGEPVGRSLAISEAQILYEAGGDPQREETFIRRELNSVLAQMTAGATLQA